MKKVISFLFVSALVLSLVACGAKKEENKEEATPVQTEEQAPAQETPAEEMPTEEAPAENAE